MKSRHPALIVGLAAWTVVAGTSKADPVVYATSRLPGASDQDAIMRYSSDGSSATVAVFSPPASAPAGENNLISMALDRSGNLYALDITGQTIQKITPDGTVTKFSSGWGNNVDALTFDAAGNLYGSDSDDRILKFGANGTFSTYATLKPSGSAPGGVAALAFDPSGNLYVAVSGDNEIDKVAADGTVSTFVTSGLSSPYAIAIDPRGDLFVTNRGDGRISEITPDGTISTFATITGKHPTEISFGPDGDLYVADHSTSIYRITPAGVVSPFAFGLDDPRGVVGAFAVPEPSTWLMVVAGLGLSLGAVGRRSSRGVHRAG